jgi:ligand-binding sensor domain-containing protein
VARRQGVGLASSARRDVGRGAEPLEDRQGNLWIGTTSGLIRKTGDRVVYFTSRQGLPAGEVQVLRESRGGQLWIGLFGGGLVRYQDGRFESFSIQQGLEGDEVASILEDREGSLWVGTTNGGLNRFRDPIVTTYGKREGLPTDMLWSVAGDGDSLWLGTDLAGLVPFRGRQGQLHHLQDPIPRQVGVLHGASLGRTLWVGGDHGLSRFRAGRWEDLDKVPGAPTDWISAIYPDSGGVLWIGAGSGIYRWKDGAFHSYTKEAGIKRARVWTIEKDRQGTLWFGTTGEA